MIDLDAAEGVSNPEPIRSVFPKDIPLTGVDKRSDQAGGSKAGTYSSVC